MADNNKNKSQKDLLGEIANNTSVFGKKIKVPSKTGNEREEEVNLMEVVLRGISSALFGKYVKDPSQIESIFKNPKNSIFGRTYVNINNIAKTVTKTADGAALRITNPSLDKLDNINDTLDEIKDMLGDNKSSNINKVVSSSDYANNAVQSLKDLLAIVKDNKFEELKEIISKPVFKNLLESINENLSDQLDKNVVENVNTIKSFIQTLSEVSKINLNELKRSERTLDFVNNGYINEIYKTLKQIDTLYETTNEIKISDHLSALRDIIDTIPSIASLSLKDILWSRISINYLNDFIKDKIPSIITTLNDVLQNTSDLGDKTEKLDKCINSILSIFKLNPKDLEDNEETIELINSLIKNDISKLIETINTSFDNLDNIILRINNITTLINSIDDMQKMLPSIMSIFKSIIKLSFIQEEIDAISVILFPNELQEKYKIHIFKAKRNHFKEISKNLENFGEILKTLNKVNEDIRTIKIGDVLKILTNVNTELVIVNKLFNKLTKLDKKYKTPLTFEGLQQTLNNFNDYVMSDIEDKFNDEIIDKINSISSFVDSVNSLIVILNNLDIELLDSIDMSKFSGAIESKLRVLMTSVDYIKNEDINEDIIKKIDILDKVITKIALLSNLKLLETISEKSLDGLIGVTDKFLEITNKFKQIKEDDVKGANKMLNSLMKLVIGTTTVLLFGTLMMSFINPLSLISFTVSLGAFIFGILWVYSKISKDQLESSFSSAKDLGLLIALSGAVLVFGSLFMKFVNITELFGFAGTLWLFISGIIVIYAAFAKDIKETFTSAYDLGLLIAISGGTLILGSLFYHFINWDDLVGFSLTLGAFIFGILGIYAFLNKWFGNAMKGAKEFSILLGVSAGLLILGALIGNWVWENWKPIVKFGIMLFAFVSIFGAVWCGLSWMFKKSLKGAKEFAILVTVSAVAMLLGPALINLYGKELGSNYWERLGAIAVWGITLGGFVLLVGWALSLANKNGKSSILGALALSVAIGVAAAALIAGPILLKRDHVEWYEVGGFAVLLAGFIFGMTYLLNFVGDSLMTLAKGALAVVLIGAIAYGAAWVVKEISDMLFDVHWEDLLNGLGQMGLVFGAVGTVMGILGAIVTGTGGVALLMAAGGAAILGMIEGLVWGAAKVINAIANSMMNLDKAAKIFKDGNNVQSMMEMINAFGNVLKLLCDKISLKMAAKLTTIMPGVIMGISALSMIGNVVKDWANMWVSDIDPKTGKKKGYRKLTDTEISTAITNIKTVIEAIGTAIRNVIDDPKNKDMFAEGFLSGKSPFRVVMESFKYSGDVLSSIAEGVKQWSSMAIPNGFDDKGKPKGYISLNDAALTHAQENIENVLTAIGQAIVNTINGHKNLFSTGENSPAIIAAKSINITSQALMNIADVIKKLSDKNFSEILKKMNNKDPKNPGVLESIKGIMESICDIVGLFLKPQPGSRSILGKFFKGEKTFAEHLNDSIGDINKSVKSIDVFSKDVIAILNSITKITDVIQAKKSGLELISDTIYIWQLRLGLQNLMGLIDGVMQLDNKKLAKINASKQRFEVFSQFVKIIDDFINSIVKYDSTAQTNLIMLTEGMINLYMTTQFINKNLFFKEFVNDTERFIQAINTLDLSKISSLSQLTQALNEIASKFGNLDELTDALANKVTVVLLELVNQLRTAETVIRNAHELQERRKKLIESNIKKVKEIMSQHMIVEIGKKEESEQLSSGAPGTIKYPGETNTGGGGRDTTAELESPETPNQGAGDAEKEKVKNGVGSAKPLTADEFVNLMKKHMSDSIWTS